MAITRRYRCPDCSYEFSFLHLTRDEPPPRYCSGCGQDMTAGDHEVPSAPNIGTSKGKAVDAAYDQTVAASKVRAEAAGDPSLVVTNMGDNLRAGDTAFKGPQPSQEYTKTVSEIAPDFSPWQANTQTHVASAAAVRGKAPSGGAIALQAIQGGKGAPPPAASSIRGSWGGGS